MKKLISAFISTVVLISCVSCGNLSENSSTENTESEGNVMGAENTTEALQVSDDSDNEKSTQSPVADSNEEDSNSENAVETSVSEGEVTSYEQTSEIISSEQEFSNIDIELTTGTLYITAGDSFSLTRKDGKQIEYSVSDDTLYIPDQHISTIMLTLPENDSYNTVKLSVDKGHVYAEQSLNMKTLDLDLKGGEVKIEKISVSEGCKVSIEKGSAFLYGDIAGVVEAQCHEGLLKLQVSCAETDFNYNMELSDADIHIGGENYHRTMDKVIDNNAGYTMNLFCRYGEIFVEFRE